MSTKLYIKFITTIAFLKNKPLQSRNVNNILTKTCAGLRNEKHIKIPLKLST